MYKYKYDVRYLYFVLTFVVSPACTSRWPEYVYLEARVDQYVVCSKEAGAR